MYLTLIHFVSVETLITLSSLTSVPVVMTIPARTFQREGRGSCQSDHGIYPETSATPCTNIAVFFILYIHGKLLLRIS